VRAAAVAHSECASRVSGQQDNRYSHPL
jgi:hypothetical protein